MGRELITVLFLYVATAVSADYPLDLGGSDWRVVNSNRSVSLQGTVPGDIFGDLMTAGIIGDPYYRFNDDFYRWVSYESWTYTKTFKVPADLLSFDEVYLVAEGLDTVASVYINEQLVASTNNMFRKYRFSVKSFLTPNQNKIEVRFTSGATYAQSMYASYPYPVPWSPSPDEIPYRHFIRREQCSYGWDWGPAFVPVGIWRPISLFGVTGATIETSTPIVSPILGGDWLVTASVHMLATKPSSGTLAFSVGGVKNQTTLQVPKGESDYFLSLIIPGDDVELWWPNGKGSQPLYTAATTWDSPDNAVSSSKNVAFRNVTLVQAPYDDSKNIGTSFYFVVNDLPVFAKGANWIPADTFESRVDTKRITSLLTNAITANMNIIRNWGGGIYQQDEFYDFCDRNGLMVWEEFMFACAMYPRDQPFLDNVAEEVKYQMSRLAHHPSIILWASNNENEAALGWYPETRANRDLYLVDEVVLYIDTLRANILAKDSSRPFLFSSPTNGALVEDPYVLRWGDVTSQSFGDVHFYDYDFLCTNESAFPNARFVSEYGWQSFPSYYSWKDVTTQSDLFLNSTFMQHRQHHVDGNTQLVNQMQKHFRFPTGKSDPVASFQDFIYLSQAVQAICIRAQTEHYRRNKDLPYNTMGALYWQFNDVWQAPTWSSLEYSGRWKMLHYFVKNFFTEVLVSSYMNDTVYFVKAVNDLPKDITGVINVAIYTFDDSSIVKKLSQPVKVPALGAASVSYTINTLLCGSKCYQMNEVFAVISLTDEMENPLSDNYYYFTPLRQVSLPSTSVKATNFKQNSNTIIQFDVTSAQAAPFVWIESPVLGHYSDNGFLLVGGSKKTIVFYGDVDVVVSDFVQSLTISTVVNTYM